MVAKRSILRLVGVVSCAIGVVARGQQEPAATAAPPAVVKKDVPYVPTQPAVVEKMLELAGVKPTDVVYDLGCGDGRMVIAAAKKYGARGYGIDIDPQRIKESKENAQKEGVTDKVEFMIQDLFDTDFRDATVMLMYLLPEVNMKLRPTILNLKPGARIVSHDFDMEDWEPDQKVEMENEGATVYFWIVPAKVEGSWNATIRGGGVGGVGGRRDEQQGTLHLKQEFQNVSGTVEIGGKTHAISDGRLRGAELTFALPTGAEGAKVTYTCNVSGNKIDGVAKAERQSDGNPTGAAAASGPSQVEATLAATRSEGGAAGQGAEKKKLERP